MVKFLQYMYIVPDCTLTLFPCCCCSNLEYMGIARKRKGWRFQYPTREYYHRWAATFTVCFVEVHIYSMEIVYVTLF